MITQLLYKIWSLSPILSVTRDDNYGYNKLTNSEGLRFSLLNLMLGHTTYYFVTFRRIDRKIKFKFIERLSLTECQWRSDQEGDNIPFLIKDAHIKELSKTYIHDHKGDTPDDLMVQKEFLLYLQNNNSQRKNLSYEKMSFYTASVLVFLPLIPTFFEHTFQKMVKDVWFLSILYLTLFHFLIFMLINWGTLVIQYMSVSGIEKSTFKNIKNPPEERNQQEQLLYSYYFDWQEERFETNLRVAYVRTTEVFIKAAIISIVILMILPCIADLIHHSPRTDETNKSAYIYSIDTSQLKNPFSEDSIAMAELHTQVCISHPKKILVFANSNIETENIIHHYLQPYREYIDIIAYTDMDIESNRFKTVLLK